MKFQAVIFDLDGTIISTDTIWKQARLEVLRRRNIPLTPEFVAALEAKMKAFNNYHESCQILKEMGNLSDPLEVIRVELLKIGKALYHHEPFPYIKGFENFHDKIKALRLPTAIATNCTYNLLGIIDKKINLKKHFGQHMYSAQSTNNRRKPDPAIFLYAAAQLGIEPSKCLVIEDSTNGIAAAKAAGMTCIGINTALDREFIKKADFKADSYDEIDIESIIHLEK